MIFLQNSGNQSIFSCCLPLYYQGAGASFVVYDITSPESFNKEHILYCNTEGLKCFVDDCSRVTWNRQAVA